MCGLIIRRLCLDGDDCGCALTHELHGVIHLSTRQTTRAFRRLLAITTPLVCAARLASAQQAALPYQDLSLSFEARAKDLVSRMTLDEKVSQMKDAAPGIPRLGVPAYNWWNEALHGVARSGLATVFPQAIGLAAMWDDSLMFRVATTISDEARAKHHEYLRHDSRQRYQGLTFWSPNINLFRDPRWGRGQETYGEDPFLTGRLAVQFVRGLQGDDPRYLKTVSTVKHYAVHSGPEPDRHTFDAVVSERDLRESYLPHFEAGIREGGAYSLMCAYNAVYGRPACGSDLLLEDILRGEWKFPGYVVSDCGAINDMYSQHHFVPTAAEASATAVKSGTDLECGQVYSSLVEAVRGGLITESAIDTAVTRLMLARMKLGMFDPPDSVRWAKIPFSVLDQPANRALALQAAHESIVLLKNAGDALPLRKNLGTIAVIGPNADQPRMLLGNYNGEPADPITPLRGIREAVSGTTRVLYALGSDLADGFPVLEPAPTSAFTTMSGYPGVDVQFFASHTMQGNPLFARVDSTVNVNWKDGAPRADMNPDDFGVRWLAVFRPSVTGDYRLGLVGTIKFRLFVDDSMMFRSVYPAHDGEYPDPRLVQTPAMHFEAGQSYRITVEGEETTGDARLQLVWATPREALEADAVRAAQQADAVVLVLGLTARLEGEEMPVEIPGFRGGDRTSLELPAPQEQLLERIVSLNKPTVLVLMSGSAVSTVWAQEHIPAILETWYPGQAAGTAVADVLFGDYNPAGRLPVTFYRSVRDLPPFTDYGMANRTYRFFSGTPLYPFGHGLSYTKFQYKNVRTSGRQVSPDGRVDVSVDVTNTGKRAGSEVVQLYVQHMGSKVARPREDLRGYQRVALQPGETKTVVLPLLAKSLAYWDSTSHGWVVEQEPIRLRVGASSADIRGEAVVEVKR
jgi:beta-glucosidase